MAERFDAVLFYQTQTSKILSSKCLVFPNCPQNSPKKSQDVRLNNTSCQVYIGLKQGAVIPESVGDLIFTSEAANFSTDELSDFHTKSRTFFHLLSRYPTAPKKLRYSIVASLNAKWKDWNKLTDHEYAKAKERLCEESLVALEKNLAGYKE